MARLSAVPALRSNAAKLKLKQRSAMFVGITLMLLGPLSMLINVTSNDVAVPYQLPPWLAERGDIVAFAHAAAEDYLSGKGTKLPVAKDVPTDLGSGSTGTVGMPHEPLSVSEVKWNTGYSTMDGQRSGVRVRFLLRSNGVMYNLDVQVFFDYDARGVPPVLAGVPTLTPLVNPARIGQVPGIDTPGVDSEGPSGSDASTIDEAIKRWAVAYAGGDSVALKNEVNVGSNNPENEYQPLLGVQLNGDPDRLGAKLRPQDGDPETPDEAFYIVRVRLPLIQNGFEVASEYDLLVRRGSPANVVAWSVPGYGDQLSPQANAL